MRSLGFIALLIAGCSSAPALPKVGAPVSAAAVAAIKAMPEGPAQVEAIAALIARATPAATLKYDAFAAHKRADNAAVTAHYRGHIVVLQDARVERGWSAKEDGQGIATAQVKSTDGMVGEGFRFAKADEARVIALRPEQTITATCLLLNGLSRFTADALAPAGCILAP